ncbi:Bug family tripartite tricarboxylate transporter substrate binding protein [Ottowia thiooxydans]|uniref:Tripartite-type tricarboxylate transporter receptor subunit TctC n=1 Tax=Ottowia thiooxydans TaxID=219182 RepID=A0ABV2QBK3_9BURK
MKILKKAHLGFLLAACIMAPGVASAAYPEQPIKLIVGFPPGGGGDLYGRLVAQEMGKSLGQTVIVENRAGAGGNIAADVVAKAKPDGYTLLLAMSGNFAVAQAVRGTSLAYKVPQDFEPIGLILESPIGVFVAHNSPYKTLQDLIAAAKGKSMTYASTGTGGAGHLDMEMVKQAAKVNMLHVPYRGSGPAITDMMGGSVDSFLTTASPLIGQVRQKQLRLLAIGSPRRNPALPDVPTFMESGVNVEVEQWYGLVAPACTPPEIVKTLSRHLSMALAAPNVRSVIRKDGALERDVPMSEFKNYILQDIERYKSVVTPELLKEISP